MGPGQVACEPCLGVGKHAGVVVFEPMLSKIRKIEKGPLEEAKGLG
jgi:hypothetical protein